MAERLGTPCGDWRPRPLSLTCSVSARATPFCPARTSFQCANGQSAEAAAHMAAVEAGGIQRRTARIAGALYLFSAVAAGAPIVYVSNVLIESDDAAKTAANILGSEAIFRACLVSELIGATTFIFLVRALYRLLAEVSKAQASLMVTFVLISVPITFVNVLNEVGALSLLHGGGFLGVFNGAQREALALFFLNLHGDGTSLANIFWGLWLFPFGALVMRSGFIPRILGVLLILNGVALIVVSLTALTFPAYLDNVSRYAVIPELGELWMMAWLLIYGRR